jgi:multidrug efflux pump subunit AcrA (membrane-fusion protein)
MPLDARLTLAASTDGRRARRRRVRNLVVVAVITVVAVGARVAFAGSPSAARYRTATASSHATDQVLNGVGTIEPVSQASVAFPGAGTVASVAVKPGDTVVVGTTLASLDEASLQQAIGQAQADVDQANLTLERARNGQSATSSGAISEAAAQPTAFSTGSGDSANAILVSATVADQDLAAAQQAVLDAQKQVDRDLIAADQAYASAQQICAAITSTDGTTTTTINSSVSSTTSTQQPAGSSSDDVTACSNALDAVLHAQHQVSTSQAALATVSSALDKLIAQRAADLGSNGGAGTTTDPKATNGSAPTETSNSRASTSPSAADLAAYQSAVDAADANLAVAQQALLQATIVSPIDGTIVAVNMAPGDAVTAGSTTATIVIAGSGGYETVTMAKVTDLPRLKVGQDAVVQPDGAANTIAGKVTQISLVSTSSSTGTTYAVVVGLSGDTSQLHNGGTGSIAITTASAPARLVVPSSAVHANSGRYTVVVLEGDTTKNVTVQVGAIGSKWTEVKRGLSLGQTVVLADFHQALPTSATSSSNGQQQNLFTRRGGFGPPAN